MVVAGQGTAGCIIREAGSSQATRNLEEEAPCSWVEAHQMATTEEASSSLEEVLRIIAREAAAGSLVKAAVESQVEAEEAGASWLAETHRSWKDP